MLYIIVCSANILCIWNWALNWASFLIDRFVDSVISQLTACFHQKHNILVIFLYLEEKEKRKITVNIFLNAHTQWLQTASVNPEMPHGLIYLSMDVCWAFSLVMSLLYYLSLLPYQNYFCAPEYNREICPSTLTNKTITERRTVLWFGCILCLYWAKSQ